VKKSAIAILVVVVVALAGVTSYIVLAPAPSSSGTPTFPPPHASCSSSAPPPYGPATAANGAGGNWTTYHGDNVRSGDVPMGNVTTAHPQWAGPVGLDGDVYAEPLVCGNSVFVATEDDSVYSVNATTGGVLWHTHLGAPVPGSTLPCGDIDPSGITGTPVIDLATRTLYAVAFLSSHQHVLFGLNIDTGSVTSQVPVDPVGSNPLVEQQRGALVLANGFVYIPYGGLDGDCGSYHGWVVGVPVNGVGGLLSYQVPTGREGGIWGPAGFAVAANGDLYVATGNSEATTVFDYGDAVIELSPSLQVLDYFAPTNWAQLNSGDVDLGSEAPTVLPNGDVFQVGKEGVGYLLSGSHLGGIGGQLYNESVCSGAYAGTAHVGQSLLLACLDGIVRVNVGTTTFSVTWQTSSFVTGAPVVTGNVVWAIDTSNAHLLGFNFTTGQQLFSFPLGTVDHFVTPAAAPGSLFVGAGGQLYSFALG
jgi:outer membrane protein assembly factor BamB